jgi:hypothetical protein
MDPQRPPGPDDPTPEDAQDLARLTERMRDMMTRRDEGRVQQRDAHTKMHGLTRAEFSVPADLPAELKVGLFARPATYRAWLRWSNSASQGSNDRDPDIRGLGIKLMGVPGEKVLADARSAPTHDFLLATAPNFPASTAGETDTVLKAMLGGLLAKLRYGLTHPWGAWIVFATKVHHANLLQETFFSTVPYAFGDQVVRYLAVPRQARTERPPGRPAPDFLRERLVRDLAAGEAVFDFCVQFQRDEASMPRDDLRRTWSQRLSPPRKVATLRILAQDFDTEARRQCGENLSFTPWHCLPEHQPLGRLNRTRRLVYETLSAYRHARNGTVSTEPTDWTC